MIDLNRNPIWRRVALFLFVSGLILMGIAHRAGSCFQAPDQQGGAW